MGINPPCYQRSCPLGALLPGDGVTLRTAYKWQTSFRLGGPEILLDLTDAACFVLHRGQVSQGDRPLPSAADRGETQCPPTSSSALGKGSKLT
jgi:hypothetical protein